MAKEPVETQAVEQAPATVPQEEYQKLYDQAINLDQRYRRLTEAYNALLELYLAKK